MSVSFSSQQGLIIVGAEIEGTLGDVVLRLALDTGATSTVINVGILVAIGYDPALASERFQITTGSGVEFVPRITLKKIVALEQTLVNFPVLCHTLPPSTGVDGLLGVDFFQEQTLTIDFSNRKISLL